MRIENVAQANCPRVTTDHSRHCSRLTHTLLTTHARLLRPASSAPERGRVTELAPTRGEGSETNVTIDPLDRTIAPYFSHGEYTPRLPKLGALSHPKGEGCSKAELARMAKRPPAVRG